MLTCPERSGAEARSANRKTANRRTVFIIGVANAFRRLSHPEPDSGETLDWVLSLGFYRGIESRVFWLSAGLGHFLQL
jgi:hypothetical protein